MKKLLRTGERSRHIRIGEKRYEKRRRSPITEGPAFGAPTNPEKTIKYMKGWKDEG